MGGERILVLDDEGGIRFLIQEELEGNGYLVETAEDGEKGIEAVRAANQEKKPFDLYISDVKMPNMDGPRFYELVNQLGINGAPIIYMTAGMNAEQEKRVAESRPYKILDKPFQLDVLLVTVANALKPPNQDLESRMQTNQLKLTSALSSPQY